MLRKLFRSKYSYYSPIRYLSDLPCRVRSVSRSSDRKWVVVLEYDSTGVVEIDDLDKINVREGQVVVEGTLIGYIKK